MPSELNCKDLPLLGSSTLKVPSPVCVMPLSLVLMLFCKYPTRPAFWSAVKPRTSFATPPVVPSPPLVAVVLGAAAVAPPICWPYPLEASSFSNSFTEANASSGEAPAVILSLNILNDVLLFEAALTALPKDCVAFIIAEGSPLLTAFVRRKAAAATLASLLPVKEDAASNSPAVSPRPYASTALNICSPVLTSAGMLELIPVALIAEFIKPGMLPVLIAFAPETIFFAVPMSKPPMSVKPNPPAEPNPLVNAPSTFPWLAWYPALISWPYGPITPNAN